MVRYFTARGEMSQKKGHFNQRGVPELWDEMKKGVKIMMTPTAIVKLDELARWYLACRGRCTLVP